MKKTKERPTWKCRLYSMELSHLPGYENNNFAPVHKNFYEYDPVEDEWVEEAPIPTGRTSTDALIARAASLIAEFL